MFLELGENISIEGGGGEGKAVALEERGEGSLRGPPRISGKRDSYAIDFGGRWGRSVQLSKLRREFSETLTKERGKVALNTIL